MNRRMWRDYDDGFDEDALYDDEYAPQNWIRDSKQMMERMRTKQHRSSGSADNDRAPRKPSRHKSWQTSL